MPDWRSEWMTIIIMKVESQANIWLIQADDTISIWRRVASSIVLDSWKRGLLCFHLSSLSYHIIIINISTWAWELETKAKFHLDESSRAKAQPECRLHKHTWFCGGDKQTLQQTCFRRSASCVQSFDDSLDIAIRITYRISLRSSSLWEPRHPLLKVLNRYFVFTKIPNHNTLK